MADHMFPSLIPKLTDPLWFQPDKPCDDDMELTKLEEEHKAWLQSVVEKHNNCIPIGKPTGPTYDDGEDQEDEGDGDDASESDNDDELDTDMIDERESGDDSTAV